MTRWLGVDHGTKRIGLAVSDAGGGIASPLEVLTETDPAAVAARIAQRAAEYEAAGVVVGWPLNMDDTEGPQGQLARRFASEIRRATGLDVRMWDERLSSMTADAKLAGRLTRKKRKARQDAVAAAAILQDFLACDGENAAPTPDAATPPATT